MIPEKYNGTNDYYPDKFGKLIYPDDSADYWKSFRNDICKIKEKSEDDFEKYLNIFGSGGLFIGLTLLSKLIEKNIIYKHQWMLVVGTCLFIICLLSNLLSHHVAIQNNYKTITEIDLQDEKLWPNFKKRNRNVGYLNWTSLRSIIVGTILLILFLTLNLNTLAEKNHKPQSPPKTTQGNPERSQDQKGRVAPQPAVVKPPKTK
ncbi:hypothetical protein [Chryseobacterium caseinilyticum]|uniref:DUF1772 domain-containing protein n=1 Tax=Chryseobacterium caseinilyticum TaxID=2771428 RepID=A0ABR8ZB86_9FLAO|nr:hypothetical protein [Chryseobacterium caseinilyticum]MBD8082349.1 hypothetical protein [Chryseobacterium caseinilyticum]